MASDRAEQERRVFGRVIGRLIPFTFACYLVAYIDRVNIGFAATEIQKSLGLDDFAYGLGAALFFLGYFAFEVPSNLILERVGARLWIARIMIVWGLISMAMVLAEGPRSFYALRVALGLAEAGFFPGVVLYLTYWIPARERAKTGALFMTATPVAMLVGAPISEALLQLDGWQGLRGWQWMFLGEGLPAVVLGLLTLLVLSDRPEQARWLAPADREWLSREMERDRAERARHRQLSLRDSLDPKVLRLCAIYFLNTLATYGVFLWLPKILKEASGFAGPRLVAITTIPFVMALVGMVVIGRHSDRTGERKWHVAACALTGALGLALAAGAGGSVPLIVLAFTLSQLGQRSIQSVFWAIPPAFLGGAAAAAGIAMINAVGNLGGFVGSLSMGWLRQASGGYAGGLLALAAALVVEAVLVATLRLQRPAAQDAAAGPEAERPGLSAAVPTAPSRGR